MKRTFATIGIGLLLFGIICGLLTSLNANNIIIEGGVRGHRALVGISYGLCISGMMISLSAGGKYIADFVTAKKQKNEQKIKEEKEKRKATPLSYIDGRLDESEFRNYLKELKRQNAFNEGVVVYLEKYLEQMDSMNVFQARLHTMLTLNGINDLQETEVLLDKLEQSMFTNLRKAFNWINMKSSVISQRDILYTDLCKIEHENDALLSKAEELCNVLTDYINNQGGTYSVVAFDGFVNTLKEQLEEV